jgi:hypothetical protein
LKGVAWLLDEDASPVRSHQRIYVNLSIILFFFHARDYLLEVGRIRNKGYFGKKGIQEERDKWKEKKHMCMHGIPNDARVRVFVIHYNGW